MEDKTVFSQYLVAAKQNKLYDGLGVWHGDYFQSKGYEDTLKTLPANSGRYPPLLLEAYM